MLSRYPGRSADGPSGDRAVVAWSSPRPMSAAGLVSRGADTVFVKRHHVRVRSAAQLAAEHAFAAHLRAQGLPVPAVWHTTAGRTTVDRGDFVYEVHEVAPGIDLYRDAMSWTPFRPAPAMPGGGCRARPAAPGGGRVRAGRPGQPAVLMNSCDVITAADPLAVVAAVAPDSTRAWPLPGGPQLASRPHQRPAPRCPPRQPAARRAGTAVGARGLASLQPRLGHRWPGRGGHRGVRLRAGQPHFRRA